MNIGDIIRKFLSIDRLLSDIQQEIIKLRSRIDSLYSKPPDEVSYKPMSETSYILAGAGLTGGGALPGTVTLSAKPGKGLGFDIDDYLEIKLNSTWSGLKFDSNKLLIDTGTTFSWGNDHSWNGDTLFIDVSEPAVYVNSSSYPDYRGAFVVSPKSASQVGLVIRGYGSQTADLLEVRNNTGSLLIRINNSGDVESSNYQSGTSGWRLRFNGDVELNNAIIRGTIYSGAGQIGGWTINSSSLSGGNAVLNSAGYLLLGTSDDIVRLDASDSSFRIWAGNQVASLAPFRVTKSGELTATSANITGVINASSGTLENLAVTGLLTVGESAPYIKIDGMTKKIESSNFSSGVSGFSIDQYGNAEFNDVVIRGALSTTVFLKNLVVANAGSNITVKSAGVLSSDMEVPSSGTWNMFIKNPPGGGFLFDNGDICTCKSVITSGVAQIWFTVSSRTDMGDGTQRYTCAYQSGTRGVTYPDGGTVLDYGISGNGGILLTADMTNSPYMSIFTHAGSPWSAITERLRIGNVAGWQSAGLTGYGLGIGDFAGNEYLYYTPSTGLVTRGTIRADDGFLVNLDVNGLLNVGTSGVIRSGASGFNSGNGFWLEYNAGTPRLFVGNASGNKMIWNGSKLQITGAVYATEGVLYDLAVSGTLTLDNTGKLITASSPNARIELSKNELAGYSDATTKQFWISSTDGKAYAGDGKVSIGKNGIMIKTAFEQSAYLSIRDAGYDTINFNIWLYRLDIFNPPRVVAFVRNDVYQNGFDASLVIGSYSRDKDAYVSIDATTGFIVSNISLYTSRTKNKSYISLQSDITQRYVQGQIYDAYLYCPLSAPLLNSAWDGDAKSVGEYTINPTDFGYPSSAKALYVRIVAKWSAASETSYFGLKTPGAPYHSIAARAIASNFSYDISGIIMLNSSSQFIAQVGGAATISTWIMVFGYFI